MKSFIRKLALRGLGAAIVMLALLGAPSLARADAVDDLAKVLDIAGTALPTIPVSGDDVRHSKKLFNCIYDAGDGAAMADCVAQSQQEPIGQKLAGTIIGGELPSWFHLLIDIYIDVRSGDFWGLVADTGMAVACAVANGVFAVDVCGIAGAVIALIGDGIEFLGDAWEFLSDIGTTVADFLGIGGSDGPPYWAYIFKNQLQGRVPALASDWLYEPDKFATKVDTSGNQPDSLYCVIVKAQFNKGCTIVSGILPTSFFRDGIVHAIGVAKAAAITQGIAEVGFQGNQWRNFKNDWAMYRSPPDRLRRHYSGWTETTLRATCGAAVEPWRGFLTALTNPTVAAQTQKVLSQVGPWKFNETTPDFCIQYAKGIQPEAIKSCEGKGSAELLPLQCTDYQWFESCKITAASGYVTSSKFPPALKLSCSINENLADIDLAKDIVAQLGKDAQGQAACELGIPLSVNGPPQNNVAKPVVPGAGGGVQKKSKQQPEPNNPGLTVVCHRDLKKARCDALLAAAEKKAGNTAVSCALRYTPAYASVVSTVKQKVAELNAPSTPIKQPGGQVINLPGPGQTHFETDKLDPLRVLLVPVAGAAPPNVAQIFQAHQATALISQNEADCADPELDGVEKPALCAKAGGTITKPELSAGMGIKKIDPSLPLATGAIGVVSPNRGATNMATAGTQLPAVQQPGALGGLQQQRLLSGTLPSKSAQQGANAPQAGGFNLPPPTQATQTNRVAMNATTGDVDRLLAPAGCTRAPTSTALAFTCSSSTGLQRCESLRQRGKLQQCTLSARR